VPLLEPDVRRIAPAEGTPTEDRAPDWVAGGTPEPLRADLERLLGADRVLARASDLVRYASDASPYRLMPRAVVMARDAGDVAAVLRYGRSAGVPVVFRAGGTSLNGQSQTDGILVDVRRHWRGIAVEDDGLLARVRPGTVLGHANRVLALHGRKLGPDPASTDIATVGGVVANNSGGMRCGVTRDSYSTVRSLTFVLPSGTTIDTAAPGAEERFAREEPELARGLAEIRDEIRADPELRDRIRRKFEIKNTTGYRLCAFLDGATPLEIFRRLIVGSEGTLAFVAEAVFETVPAGREVTTALALFPNVDAAADVVGELVAAGATATELMVAATLIVAAHNFPGTPESWKELPLDSAAILVEFRAESAAELDAMEAAGHEVLAGRELIAPIEFTRDHVHTELLWRVREGMHGLVGVLRPQGSALIIEDVCVPPARVAESAKDIMALLGEHGFLTGVAGHASAGNLHFMLTPDFTKPEDRDRYEGFMEKLVDLIVGKYDGSLKAEHGTGINMAPYVEREWGETATEMMWRVKRLADPDGVLAPGVVLSDDPGAHLRNLKSTPPIEDVATTCVECGFCEPVCPSRDLTTTPRQRIVLRREMARQPAGSPVLDALLSEYEYDAIETCAADGTCRLACPVGIDTGRLIKGFRNREHTEGAERKALGLARRWGAVEHLARTGLRAGRLAGSPAMRGLTGAARAALSHELVPAWPASMPAPAPARLPPTAREGAAAVYVPACVNRIFGRPRGAGDELTLPEALVAASARAGLPVWIPPDAAGHCCGTPWASKGYERGHRHMAEKLADSLWRWSEEGALPVVIDAASCTRGAREEIRERLDEARAERHSQVEILDSTEWAERLLARLDVAERAGSAALHPPCAARHLGVDAALRRVAEELAESVTVPVSATCCGMAGDRGMLHPELPAAAIADQAAELAGRDFDAHLCCNRTCEIALQENTGRRYLSPVVLLEKLSRASG
jgi:D-lactate dehydrogenase